MRKIFYSMIALMASLTASAQTDSIGDRDVNLANATKEGWEIELKAGLNFGGAAPLGLPREIRHIDSFNPHLNGTIEGTITKWFGPERRWGLAFGLRLEEKRMTTGARVKNYHTEIIKEEDRAAGYFTGFNSTHYTSTDLTLPVTANYSINERWKVRAGLYLSYVMDGDFSGYVSDGYLRNDTPTGEKVTFNNGAQASYDFSDDLRRLNWGLQIGGTWNAYRHFFLAGDLNYSFCNIFKSSFHTVTFAMHPIYFNIGFGYRF